MAFCVMAAAVFSLANGCELEEPGMKLPPYPVGHIPFSEELDDPRFELCNERVVLENGTRFSAYKGGTKAILAYFQPIFSQSDYFKKGDNGYLTIRFMMNCKGEKDRFRALGINAKYKPKEFPEPLTRMILDSVKNMDGWLPATDEGKPFDSYNMLTFKILDGKIIDIIP